MKIPLDCFGFLSSKDINDLSFTYDGNRSFEVRRVELIRGCDLQVVSIPLSSSYYSEYFDCEDNPEDERWEFSAVPLVLRDLDEAFVPHGLLLWFPELKRYGSWDSTHNIIFTFPNASWACIVSSLFEYINSQWDLSSSLHEPLMPWRK